MPQQGYKQSSEHKKKRAKALEGENNGAWKDGRRSYRRIAKAKDGEIVHHKDGNRKNNDRSNLEKLSDGKKKKGRRTTPKHEQLEKRAQKSDAYYLGVLSVLK